MTEGERESIIQQLSLVTDYTRKVYENLTDNQLKIELEQLYE